MRLYDVVVQHTTFGPGESALLTVLARDTAQAVAHAEAAFRRTYHLGNVCTVTTIVARSR